MVERDICIKHYMHSTRDTMSGIVRLNCSKPLYTVNKPTASTSLKSARHVVVSFKTSPITMLRPMCGINRDCFIKDIKY